MKESQRSIKNNCKLGDVLIVKGEMYMVDRIHTNGDLEVTPVSKEIYSWLFAGDFKGSITNLGQSKEVLASFYSARSIHIRLNRIKP